VAEALKPGQPLDKYAKAFLIQLWEQTLAEIGEERFDEALRHALNASTFRPDIAEIRKFAGLVPVYPTEREAKAELAIIIRLMRHHGRRLRNRGKPERDLPVIEGLRLAALVDMGYGDHFAALEAIWAHPALDQARDPRDMEDLETFRAVAGEKLEKRWIEAYTRCRAEGILAKPEGERPQ